MKSPRAFFRPLAIGAPAPLPELPQKVERMIHFIPPHLPKVRARIPEIAGHVDVVLGNLEDAIPLDAKHAAREGFIELATGFDFRATNTGLWVRINGLNSPFMLDDLSEIITRAGATLDVIMAPKIEGPWDIHYLDQLMAQLEAKAGLARPILLHAILETAEGVARVEDIALASPRLQGISLGPADLAASRRMKTTRVGGGHPDYAVIEDAHDDDRPRALIQQDPWHYTLAKMVDACAMAGIKPFYGPFGDIGDRDACYRQFRNAFLLGCAGAWTLHPDQIALAKRAFSPDPADVAFARRILEAMPDGAGVVMLDGRMQDDATFKQAQVLMESARQIAAKDPDLAVLYGLADPNPMPGHMPGTNKAE